MTTTVIRGGRVIDPVDGRDEIADLWMVDGVFADASSAEVDRDLDAAGMIVCPILCRKSVISSPCPICSF